MGLYKMMDELLNHPLMFSKSARSVDEDAKQVLRLIAEEGLVPDIWLIM